MFGRPAFEGPPDCPVCMRPLGTSGCREDRTILFQDGESEPIRYGEEGPFEAVDPCVCGAMPGQVHHAGCPAESCPRCCEEYVTCGCKTAEKQRRLDYDQRW